MPERERGGLQAYCDAMCGGTDGGQRSERFRRMSVALKQHVDMRTAAEKVTLKLSTHVRCDHHSLSKGKAGPPSWFMLSPEGVLGHRDTTGAERSTRTCYRSWS